MGQRGNGKSLGIDQMITLIELFSDILSSCITYAIGSRILVKYSNRALNSLNGKLRPDKFLHNIVVTVKKIMAVLGFIAAVNL